MRLLTGKAAVICLWSVLTMLVLYINWLRTGGSSGKWILDENVPIIPVLKSDLFQELPSYKQPKEVLKTEWWRAAALFEHDFVSRHTEYRCNKMRTMGNWDICVDGKYNITKPCLVYSAGIAYDFRFDDAVAYEGCEVHSFDPSMIKTPEHVRESGVHFHRIGLSGNDNDTFEPRRDMYVKTAQIWKMSTLGTIMKHLGHQNRVLDVLKIDIEAYEWGVLEDLLSTKLIQNVKQLCVEYHLFPDFPKKKEYPKLLRTYKRLHDEGLRKIYARAGGPQTHKPETFNLQVNVGYLNTRIHNN